MKKNTRKILLAIILVFTMVMSFATVSVFAVEDEAKATTVYLKPCAEWLEYSPRFAIYTWGDTLEAQWIDMTATDTEGVYVGEVPAGYEDIIFCRMNPNVTYNRWNTDSDTDATKPVWGQTVDLTATADGTFTILNPWDSNQNGNATGTWGNPDDGPDVGGDNTDTSDLELAKGEYYLAGYINGKDYGVQDKNKTEGHFEAFVDGKLTVELVNPSYVIVKGSNNVSYWTKSLVSSGTSATLYNESTNANEKLYVPGGKVTFTLYKGEGDTLVLTYEVEEGTEVEAPTIDDTDTVTVYAGNSAEWETVFFYCWVSGGSEYVAWPGLEMDLDENGYWYAEVPKACDNIIFNNGGNGEGNQTENLKTPFGELNTCDIKGCMLKSGNINSWFKKSEYKPPAPVIREDTKRDVTLVFNNTMGWEKVFVYYWSVDNVPGSEWPGFQLEASADGLYYAVIPKGNYKVVFSDGQEGGVQTADLVIPTDDNVLFDNTTNTWSEKYLEANHPVIDENAGGMTFLQKIAKAILLFLRSIEDFFKGIFGKK